MSKQTIFNWDEFLTADEKGWFRMSRSIAQDNSLDTVARAIMTNILSHSDGYIITKENLQAIFFPDIGRVNFNRAWKQLQERGFLIKEKIKSSNGQWNGVQYIVHPFPSNEYNNPSDYNESESNRMNIVKHDFI